MRVSNKPLMQRIPGIMTPLLVMLFSGSLAKLGWMIFAPLQDVSAAPVSMAASPVSEIQTPNLGRIIADNHLFGEVKPQQVLAQAPAKIEPIIESPTPVTPPLELNLHGLWAKKRSDGRTEESYKATRLDKADDIVMNINMDLDLLFDPELGGVKPKLPDPKKVKAFAIMSHSGGDQQMYSEGESIADEVKVIEIYVDKVVVENRGIRQEIFLSDGKSLASSDPAAQPLPANRQQIRPREMLGAVSASIAAGQEQLIPEGMSDPRRGGENLGQRDLRKLREDVLNDASLLAQYSAPEPLLMDGTVKGFRLHLSNRLRLLYQVGFRPGDVVTELNGVRLNDPATVQQALFNFISSDQLSISVMRGANEETFRYNFDG